MKRLISILLMLVLLLSLAGCSSQKNNEYVNNLYIACADMQDGLSLAEEIYNDVSGVWYDAIKEEWTVKTLMFVMDVKTKKYNDFNTALALYYIDESTKLKTDNLKSNEDLAADIMGKLNDPPDKFKNCYDTISDMYKYYSSIISLAKEPSGSYNSFTESFKKNKDEFLQLYALLQTQMPKMENIPTRTEETAPAEDPTETAVNQEITLVLSVGTRKGIYTGSLVDGLPHGKGSFTTKNEAGTEYTYNGNWAHGHMEGYGESVWETGQVYKGNSSNDKQSGLGIMTFEDGSKYEGMFYDGNFHGYGRRTSSSGEVLEGKFHKGEFFN